MLLAVVAIVVVRFLMRRFASNSAPARPAMAGAAAGGGSSPIAWQPAARTGAALAATPATNGAATLAAPAALPADFDAAAFQRIAKMIFIRLQAANDSSDVNDLRAFTTPELFASLRLDLQERGGVAQQTDVVRLDAELLDYAQENNQQIVSVRFHGLIREESEAGAQPFDEVWHLVRPQGGDGAAWAIAGIQPRQ
jgi:predicted lipid-binding transport protein (Tim44 family)